MVKNYHIENGRVTESSDPEAAILVYINPDDTECRHLIDKLALDEHTLNSALDPDEVSRLAFESDYLAIIYKRPKNYSSQDNFLFRVASTGVFLFKDRLVVVIGDDVPLFTGKQFAKITSLQDIVCRLIGSSIHHYLEHLKVIHLISDSIEEKISFSLANNHLLNIFSLDKSLVYYLNAIGANSVLIHALVTNAERAGITRENSELLEDIAVENTQCRHQAEIYVSILRGMLRAHTSISSNNLGSLIKTLIVITIAVMVPSLVVGVFSMNVKIPLAELDLAFWMIIGLSLISAATFFLLWRWKSKR